MEKEKACKSDDPAMDEKLLTELITNKGALGSPQRVTVDMTFDTREVDENGQLVISEDKHVMESDDNVSEAGESWMHSMCMLCNL